MVRFLKVTLLAALVLVFLAVLGVSIRIATYEQHDDPDALERKRAYLESVKAVAPGVDRPSFVVILFDDLGYGDLAVYGSRAIRTPALDQLASEGALLTQAYSAAPVCSPARAALLTGRYAIRSGITQAVFPHDSTIGRTNRLMGRHVRLPAHEITVAEVLRAAGYATGAFGKWHLGDHAPSLPNDLGFDTYYGPLYSNDMKPFAIYRDREIEVQAPADQTQLTRRYTEEAVAFLRAHRDDPFFLYLPHTFPHLPLHASAEGRGSSEAGLYGDVVEDLDRSVAAILATLAELRLDERTFVIITSDNGPWFQGSPGGMRQRKMSIFEGGMRVPFLVRGPGRIAAGAVLEGLAMGIDLLPTLLEWAGVPLPDDRVIDGRSLVAMLEQRAPSPHELLYFFHDDKLLAVRDEQFKFHVRHFVAMGSPADVAVETRMRRGPWLFDLHRDPSESYDVSKLHRDRATQLEARLESFRHEIQQDPQGWLHP